MNIKNKTGDRNLIYENIGFPCDYSLFLGMLVICINKTFYALQAGSFKSKTDAEEFALLILAYIKEGGVYIIRQNSHYSVRIGYFRRKGKVHNVLIDVKPMVEMVNW